MLKREYTFFVQMYVSGRKGVCPFVSSSRSQLLKELETQNCIKVYVPCNIKFFLNFGCHAHRSLI